MPQAQNAYINAVAAGAYTNAADQIVKAEGLLGKGAITQPEFDQLKAMVLATLLSADMSAARESGDLAARSQPRSEVEVADLWHFYDEHALQARQHENLRATVTGTLAAIAAAITALAGVGGLTPADVPAGIVVIIVSGLGVALSLKHIERNRFHAEVMRQVLHEIERNRQLTQTPTWQWGPEMSGLWQDAKEVHKEISECGRSRTIRG